MEIAIIGGGASGFFAAITVKENYPAARVVIFEKAETVLAKVKISGGGRCNVTNGCPSLKELLAGYPRGARVLRKGFRAFNNQDARRWFESRGVPLVVQEDGCVFPRSQDSQSIIDCFLAQTAKLKIGIETGRSVQGIRPAGEKLRLEFAGAAEEARLFDRVIVTTGGSPQRKGLEWLERLGHRIVDPVPSLFSFSMPAEKITALQGIVVEKVSVSIPGSKLKADGPLLITHWGMSGPAILKLSSFGARLLSEKGYLFKILVNWGRESDKNAVFGRLEAIVKEHPHKFLANVRPYGLPERLWRHLLEKSELPAGKKWSELGRKGLNRVVSVLTDDEYSVHGKATFKEEFVTCGGVDLESIDCGTLRSKVCPNLYFAGEILDIDGITGGYNFQAAWTTAFLAGRLQ